MTIKDMYRKLQVLSQKKKKKEAPSRWGTKGFHLMKGGVRKFSMASPQTCGQLAC